MSFDPIELETIRAFQAETKDSLDWVQSSVGYLRPTAPSTKGRFARQLIKQLAAEAGVPFGSVPGRHGNRRMIGKAICELKFSMESPARFQQVRPPSDGFQYLVGICVQHADVRSWLIPADEVARLFEDGQITFQHAETSRWFRAETDQVDAFSEFRFAHHGFVEALAQLA